jgi:uncharacterized repeat protein (TIGR03803 family)
MKRNFIFVIGICLLGALILWPIEGRSNRNVNLAGVTGADLPLSEAEITPWFDNMTGRPVRRQNEVQELVDGAATFKDMGTNIRLTGSNLGAIYNMGSSTGDGIYPSTVGSIAEGPDKCIYYCTGQGGAKGRGAVCKVTTDGVCTVLCSFDFTNGADPRGLTLGKDGNFYGACYGGGKYGTGTLWKMTPSGALTVLYSFHNGVYDPPILGGRPPTEQEKMDAGGAYPISPPVQAPDGSFYGITSYSFNQQGGVIYRFQNGAYKGLYRFKPEDVAAVGMFGASLTVGQDGGVYGTCVKGALGWGSVFKLGGGVGITPLHKFDAVNGQGAINLMMAKDGNLYGTASDVGTPNFGLVYRVTPGGAYAIIHQFVGSDGSVPLAGLTQGKDGMLYGVTRVGGAGGRGAVYRLSPDGTNFQVLHSLAGSMLEGRYCQSAPIEHSNGYWYGISEEGGTKGGGTVYKMNLINPDFIYGLNWWMTDTFPIIDQSRVWDLFKAASDRGVQVRAMLWDQYGTQNTDEVNHMNAFQNGAAILDDRTLEYGSHHQKILVIRKLGDLIGYCGGIDFNPDRLSPQVDDAGSEYHDVHCRIKGPAAGDLLTIFTERWGDHPKHADLDKAKGALVGNPPTIPEPVTGGTSWVQIGRTYGNGSRYPMREGTGGYAFAPNGEQSAAKMILHAIDNAQKFIYVEEQYFVDTAPNTHALSVRDALIKKLQQPGFQQLIVLIPHGSITDMGAKKFGWTFAKNQASYRRKLMIDELKKAAPGKVRIFYRFLPGNRHTYVHAKTWIFDDKFAIIGSANTNRRSWTHDSEVVAGICDQGDGKGYLLPHRLRMRLWAEHLGIGTLVNGEPTGYEDKLANFDIAVELWKTLPSTAHVMLYDVIQPEADHPDDEWNQKVDPEGS